MNGARIETFGNITLFGDSIPKGYTTKNGKIEKIGTDAVSLLERKYGFSVDNRSVYGQTVGRLYARRAVDRYLEEETAGGTPRTVVFCLGGNDADYDWAAVAARPDAPHEPKTPLPEFKRELNELVRKLKNAGVKVALTNLPPVDSSRFFERVICRAADGERVLRFFNGDVTNINRHQETYNLAVIETAVRNECRVIDIRTPFLMQIDYLRNYSDDGIHPNAAGHKVIAESVESFIDALPAT